MTLTATNLSRALSRYDILQAQAEAEACDLVAHGVLNGLSRGLYYDRGAGVFRTDRGGETITAEALLQLVRAGTRLTLTAVPPGSGQRIGIDRDEDNWFDRDEIDRGTNPADSSDVPQSP